MPEKLHRCVEQVMAKGHDEQSAHAICNAVMASLSDEVTDDEVQAAIRKHKPEMAYGASFTALDPSDAVLLERSHDGSGRVWVPVLPESAKIDLGLTASKSSKTVTVTVADLREMAANLAEWPGPIPISREPHKSFGESAGASDGFLEALEVRGKTLWGKLWLSSSLMYEFLSGQWRGFSVDYGEDIKLPTKQIKGMSVYGGVFTNRPATDVHFKIAAAASISGEVGSVTVPVRPPVAESRRSTTMTLEEATVQLATATAQIKAKDDSVTSLNAKLKEAKDEAIALEARVTAAEKKADEAVAEAQTAKLSADRKTADAKDAETRVETLETANKDLRVKLQAKEDETLGSKIGTMIRLAIKEGVPPAKLKVYGDYEKDPVKWFKSNFVSLEAAELMVKSLPRDAKLSSVDSGYKRDDDDNSAITPQSAQTLKSLGLDPEFAAARNEAEMREIRERKEAQKAATSK